MRLLLDTHALIWWLHDHAQLSERARKLLTDPTHETFVSSVSAWEIAIKRKSGKLQFDGEFLFDFERKIAAIGFRLLEMSWKHAVGTSNLPSAHSDPFDNMLASQATSEGLVLLSKDPALRTLGVESIW